jgi:hypothetical protein
MVQLRSRVLAGVSVPDTTMIGAALEYAQRLSEPYLFNHAVRSWLFAAKIGQVKLSVTTDMPDGQERG